jgi:hypothetical protein
MENSNPRFSISGYATAGRRCSTIASSTTSTDVSHRRTVTVPATALSAATAAVVQSGAESTFSAEFATTAPCVYAPSVCSFGISYLLVIVHLFVVSYSNWMSIKTVGPRAKNPPAATALRAKE